MSFVRWFESLGSQDVGVVGGKNASLGEMIGALQKEGIHVPEGFATTAEAYWKFLEENDLTAKLKRVLHQSSAARLVLAELANHWPRTLAVITDLYRQAQGHNH